MLWWQEHMEPGGGGEKLTADAYHGHIGPDALPPREQVRCLVPKAVDIEKRCCYRNAERHPRFALACKSAG